ncbi:hypothetical protein ACIUYQ_27350, partial [Pseudomonas aeruginosa]
MSLPDFINLMDGNGELVFSDRQATRMERAMANMEFGFGEGGYQPSEFIKRYLPQGKRLANTPPRSLLLAAWCPPVFGGHHFKPLAEDLPCQANAAP